LEFVASRIKAVHEEKKEQRLVGLESADTKHSLPSIVDNIKPKVHRIVNIFLRLYDLFQNALIAMT
jgi:hypothetical protein